METRYVGRWAERGCEEVERWVEENKVSPGLSD
jgi:hypothetical protein